MEVLDRRPDGRSAHWHGCTNLGSVRLGASEDLDCALASIGIYATGVSTVLRSACGTASADRGSALSGIVQIKIYAGRLQRRPQMCAWCGQHRLKIYVAGVNADPGIDLQKGAGRADLKSA
ncbi:hypothetical protein Adt_27384 [Abeliophyllum distichum]|uniref:Uncharacterized protein n=1 Tax=Abeliophyllum distichum TaxID=126358 RepID=A0ABD1RTN8_9LAMI